MTEKKFWRKLDNLSYNGMTEENVMAAARLLRKAYESDFEIFCACAHSSPDKINQLFICMNDNDDFSLPDSRYMLCYTSAEIADSADYLPEPWDFLPLRFVIDNALSKETVGGLVFNYHIHDRALFIPKEALGDSPKYFKEFEWTIDKPKPTGKVKQV